MRELRYAHPATPICSIFPSDAVCALQLLCSSSRTEPRAGVQICMVPTYPYCIPKILRLIKSGMVASSHALWLTLRVCEYLRTHARFVYVDVAQQNGGLAEGICC